MFRVTGRGRIGADGLAFWFTEQRGAEGPVFGSSDMWKGLGVFFDTFDNDNKHNNPYISAMINDGTKQYDHQKLADNFNYCNLYYYIILFISLVLVMVPRSSWLDV